MEACTASVLEGGGEARQLPVGHAPRVDQPRIHQGLKTGALLCCELICRLPDTVFESASHPLQFSCQPIAQFFAAIFHTVGNVAMLLVPTIWIISPLQQQCVALIKPFLACLVF